MRNFSKLKNKFQNQKGQSALVMVLVVVTVMLIVIASVGFLTYNDLKTIGNVVDSAQSYYTAESGIEDAVYRISNGKSYSTSYSLSVASGTTTVEVTGPITALVVTSNGNVDNSFRKLEVRLGTTQSASNVAFNYGIQVGYGGLYINNATVNGNVYSNGPIVALANDAVITGTAISANAPATSADQSNDTPGTPSDSITFRNAVSSEDLAQSFQVSQTLPLSKVQFYIKKTSTPNDATVTIRNNNSGAPGSTVYATGTLSAAAVTTSYGWVDITFDANPQLSSGATYWLEVDNSTNSGTKYYTVGANSTYSSGQAKVGQVGGTWNNTSPSGLDAYFKIYLGGTTGSIAGAGSNGSQPLDIGGDARSHTNTNLNITANNYCQAGSGNNKACDTSQADPTAQAFAISDGNIADWKSQAEAGTLISGDHNVSGTESLGPAKITGNLTFTNGATLNVTGTIWVVGTVTTANGVTIKLDPGYGTAGGTLVTDGYINLANGTNFLGSGQAGSYFLLVSTNDCDGTAATSVTGLACINSSAVDVFNNVGTVIIFASRGQVHLNNTAGAKEVTGYKLLLDNNTSVTYETGLANAGFSSGPGGGFDILSWKEIE